MYGSYYNANLQRSCRQIRALIWENFSVWDCHTKIMLKSRRCLCCRWWTNSFTPLDLQKSVIDMCLYSKAHLPSLSLSYVDYHALRSMYSEENEECESLKFYSVWVFLPGNIEFRKPLREHLEGSLSEVRSAKQILHLNGCRIYNFAN